MSREERCREAGPAFRAFASLTTVIALTAGFWMATTCVGHAVAHEVVGAAQQGLFIEASPRPASASR